MPPSDAAPDDELRVPTVQHEVGREHHGSSLLDAVDALWGPVDRRRVHEAVRKQQVELNGEAAGPAITLRNGDVIELYLDPEALARRAEQTIPWLHLDEQLGVAVKPAGLPFDASRGRTGQSVVERLGADAPAGTRARPVHRLDKETSGVVPVAFSRAEEQRLGAAFAAGEAFVEYFAVLRWPPAESAGLIDVPLIHGRRSDQGLHPDPDHGSPARTHWEIVERWGSFARLRVRPEGGRSHQVRAHLAALGHPVLGDRRYGEDAQIMLSQLKLDYRPKRGRPERPLLRRPALHAERFVDRERDLDITAPLPDDLSVLARQLERLAARNQAR